ncbi:hypothetical protein Tco_0765574 [Tanacetum coccineum]
MLIYAKAPLFLWAEVVATACYTQNRSIVRLCHGKTSYEILHDKLPDLLFFHVFSALRYPTNDSENFGKLQLKADIDFDELTAMAFKHSSSGPVLHEMTPATISLGLVPSPPPSIPFVPPLRNDWDLLFQPLFNELLTPLPSVDCSTPEVIALTDEVVAPVPAVSTGSPSSTTVDQDAPSPSNSQTTPETQSPIIPNDVEEHNHDLDVAQMNNDPFFGISILENNSEASSSSDVIPIVVQSAAPYSEHVTKWTKDHPSNNITNYKDALTQACWIEAMQEELNKFEHLEVWELIPCLDKLMVITLKWIYKVKLDELGGILKNKAHLVARDWLPPLTGQKDVLRLGSTPMVEKSKLDEDTQGKAVDPTHYRGMIGTIMYLTASRPDLTFAVCMCARYQAKPTEKHLHATLITWVAKILDEVLLDVCNYWQTDLLAGHQKGRKAL